MNKIKIVHKMFGCSSRKVSETERVGPNIQLNGPRHSQVALGVINVTGRYISSQLAYVAGLSGL